MNVASWSIGGVDLVRLEAIAERLDRVLPLHQVVALRGTLGAGKTRLVQAIARAAGIDPLDVTSPTFGIVHHHRGRRSIHHIDAYRLADEDEFIELGGEELLEEPGALSLVEWPQRVAGCIPPSALWIDIEIECQGGGDGRRRLTFSCEEPRRIDAIRDACKDLSPTAGSDGQAESQAM